MNVVDAFSIPDGFPEILKGFTREALRAQPEDINQFAAEYFANLAATNGPADGEYGAAPGMSVDLGSMRNQIESLFLQADVEGKGYLTRYVLACPTNCSVAPRRLTNPFLTTITANNSWKSCAACSRSSA